MSRQVIEPGGRGMTYRRSGGFTVYELSTYPRNSVLSGQQRRVFKDSFDTLEDAKTAFPNAILIEGTSYQTPDLSHLPEDDDY